MTADEPASDAEAQARAVAALVVARASRSEVDAIKAANAQLILKIAEYAQSQHSASAWMKAGDELRALLLDRDRSALNDTSGSADAPALHARGTSVASTGESAPR